MGPVNENGMWWIRYNDEIFNLYSEPNIVNIIKVAKLRWIGHIMRMEEENTTRRLTLLRPDGGRMSGRPKLRWMDDIEEDLRKLCVSGWRRKALDRKVWRNVLRVARGHKGL